MSDTLANTAHGNPEMRSAILSAAMKVFQARGYTDSTVEAVAQEAGIAKGSIYNYFQSKHDLFAQVFASMIQTAQAEMAERIARPGTAGEKLDAVLDFWFGQLGHYKKIGRVVLEFWAAAAREEREGELSAMLRDAYAESRRMLSGVLAEGMDSGEFGRIFRPEEGASLLLAFFDGVEIQSIFEVGVNKNEEFLKSFKKAVLAGLTPDGSQGSAHYDSE